MTEIVATTLRLPKELLESIRENAKEKGLTLNALILQILWKWENRQGENENVHM